MWCRETMGMFGEARPRFLYLSLSSPPPLSLPPSLSLLQTAIASFLPALTPPPPEPSARISLSHMRKRLPPYTDAVRACDATPLALHFAAWRRPKPSPAPPLPPSLPSLPPPLSISSRRYGERA